MRLYALSNSNGVELLWTGGNGVGMAGTSGSGAVRWGILATGGIAASFTTDLLEMADAQVIAVGSRRPESAKRFAERFGIPRAYGGWAELAADDDIDVIYVATPHSAHREAAGLCLEAGRAVLCEKPFTLNVRQAEELVDLARARGRFLMEAMWTYCDPVVRRMTELVHDGAIGEVRAVHADFGLPGPIEPDHRLRDPALGGGALLDLGVYPVSFAQLPAGGTKLPWVPLDGMPAVDADPGRGAGAAGFGNCQPGRAHEVGLARSCDARLPGLWRPGPFGLR